MKFYSEDFSDYGQLDNIFAKDGDNVSPVFKIDDVPDGTISLVLTVHDLDSPGGKEWTHWLVWDIPPSTSMISSANVPKGALEGLNDFGEKGYGGPLPTVGSGNHRYIFSLYALDTKLTVELDATREQLLRQMAGHIHSQSMWVGTYRRD